MRLLENFMMLLVVVGLVIAAALVAQPGLIVSRPSIKIETLLAAPAVRP